jgi:DOPA 4,5-dioxygenase
MKKSIHGYHAHIYFDDKTMAVAAALRQGLLDEHGHLIRVHGLISEPIGPHPLPMFEADIRPGELEKVLNWLLLNHGVADCS